MYESIHADPNNHPPFVVIPPESPGTTENRGKSISPFLSSRKLEPVLDDVITAMTIDISIDAKTQLPTDPHWIGPYGPANGVKEVGIQYTI